MPQRADRIPEAANHLRNHTLAITIHVKYPAVGYGGAAEPHVSHVLSNRLGSRPIGWSKETLLHFARILANVPEVPFELEKQASHMSMAAVKAFETTRHKLLATQRLLSKKVPFPSSTRPSAQICTSCHAAWNSAPSTDSSRLDSRAFALNRCRTGSHPKGLT